MIKRLFAVLAILLAPLPLRADQPEVDVALVIAVDISLSMDVEEQALQRNGFIEAFRAAEVHQAVRSGMLGRIAVAYVEWAGVGSQQVVVPWSVIGGAEDARAFADRLAATPPRRSTWTSISAALDFSAKLLDESGLDATRRVIDVSGDGPNNQGRLVTQARDAAVRKGIVINGLPLMLKEPSGAWDIADLDIYYRDCVIGGQGAFMIPIRDKAQFAGAVRTKILREVADLRTDPLVKPAQAEAPMDCRIGERRVGGYDRN